jgi:hypothetical protein
MNTKEASIFYFALDLILRSFDTQIEILRENNVLESIYIPLNKKGRALRLVTDIHDKGVHICYYGDLFGDADEQIFLREDLTIESMKKFILIAKSEFDII